MGLGTQAHTHTHAEHRPYKNKPEGTIFNTIYSQENNLFPFVAFKISLETTVRTSSKYSWHFKGI